MENHPPSPRPEEFSDDDEQDAQQTVRTWRSTQKCTSCTTRAEISEHYRQLKMILRARWETEFDTIGTTLGYMNRIVAPRISATTWFNELAVGIPPPRRCRTCRRTSYFSSLLNFQRGQYTSIGGYKEDKIPWEAKGTWLCIACLDEYVRWTHNITAEE